MAIEIVIQCQNDDAARRLRETAVQKLTSGTATPAEAVAMRQIVAQVDEKLNSDEF